MMIQLEAEDRLDWICLLNENTELDLRNLNELVQKKSLRPREEALFFGRALQDREPTIIHHFSQDKLLYPDLEAGVFFSRKLVLDLWRRIKDPESLAKDSQFPSDFNIDPAYEFAKFVFSEGEGVALENIAHICTQKASGCVTYSRNDFSCTKRSDTTGLQAILSNTLVAVKTCSKYHKDRLKAVRETWAPLVENLLLVSDKEDPELGTKVLPFTVNTEAGHCNKTLAILEHFRTEEQFKFLVIVDDDTVLSVTRLAQLLSCYSEDDAFLLGQRYGYMSAGGAGYSYITGGGGMILNRAGVTRLLAPPPDSAACSCPAPETPDDMQLGRCARRLQLPVLHSGRMFQVRAISY